MNATFTRRQVFLQDCGTKKFLGAENSWVERTEDARDFENTLNAVAHALADRLLGAQVLVRFSDMDREDIVVPISCDAPR